MNKICPNCYQISKGERSSYSANILLGAFFLGAGFAIFPTDLFGSKILGLFLTIFMIFSGCMYILSYFYGGKKCPTCNYQPIMAIENKDAQVILTQIKNNLQDNKKLCVICLSIADPHENKKPSFFWSIILMILGLLMFLVLLIDNDTSVNDLVGTLIFLGFGIYGTTINIINKESCLICNNKNCLIPLYTERAERLMNENNISIKDNSRTESDSYSPFRAPET